MCLLYNAVINRCL